MKKILFVIALCWVSIFLHAQTWINLGSSTPKEISATVTDSSSQTIHVHFSTQGFYSESINVGNIIYQRLSIPGTGKTYTVGNPELPSFSQMVAIPECSNVSLSFQVLQEQVLDNYNIYPAPDYQEVINTDSTSYVEEVFSKNDSYYVDNIVTPSINVEMTETGYFRSQKYAEIQVSPIRYNPAMQKLYVAKEIEVTLTLTNATGPTSANLGIFNNVAAHTMLNYESTGMTAEVNDMRFGNGKVKYYTLTDYHQVDTIVVDYLMICASHLFDENGVPCEPLLELAQHRASYNGYDVVILNVDNILEQGFSYQSNQYRIEEKLRSCIYRIYQYGSANHTYDGKIGFVLLVGKAPVYDMNVPIESCQGFVPSAYSHGIVPHVIDVPRIPYPSDYWFSCITNNYGYPSVDPIGDLFIGRICVDNSVNAISQLQNLVSKTINREKRFNPRVRDIVNSATGAGLEDSPNFDSIFYEPLQGIIGGNRFLSKVDFYEVNSSGQYSDSVNHIIANGAPLFIMINHGGIGGWANVINPEFVDNSGTMNQFCLSHSCSTGRFDTIQTCLGQRMTSGYNGKGFVGFIGPGRPAAQTLSMDLDLPRAIYQHLSHISGECLLESKLAIPASQSNVRYIYNLIGDPALNIMARGFEVTDDITLSDSTDITTTITIKDGGIIRVPINARIRIHDNAGLNITYTGRLHFKGNATLRSVNGNNSYLKVNGGTVTYYTGNPGTTIFKDLVVDFRNPKYFPGFGYQFDNHRYYNCSVSAVGVDLAYSYCQFYDGCSLYASHSALDVDHSEFEQSGIVVSRNSVIGIPVGGGVPPTSAVITNSTFINCGSIEYQHYGNYRSVSNAAIRLERVPNYELNGNIIMGCLQGIFLTNSGTSNLYSIAENSIQNNTQDGVIVYNSYANLTRNTIQGNGSNLAGNGNEFEGNGISIYNNSLTQVGDVSEPFNNYQLIGWNCNHQLYASNNAFPQLFRYNKVLGDKNGTTNPWIYYDVEDSSSSDWELINVEYNNWDGNMNFNASNVFNLPGLFDWNPFWNMAKGGGGTGGCDAATLYVQAKTDFEDSLYSKARTEFMQLVSDYSEDPLAVSALKEIFRLERFLNNDYSELKSYFLTNEKIMANSTLQKVGDFLSARCDVEMKNYSDALGWYTEQLSNDSLPYQDSVFCVIDIGDICLLMAEDSVNRGVLPVWLEEHSEILPKSCYDHQKNTEYLLSTLPFVKHYNGVKEVQNEYLSSNAITSISPNPTSTEVRIVFQLEKRFCSVEIRIIDMNGKIVAVKKANETEVGNNVLCIDNIMIPQGVYVCALFVDGKLCDQERIMLIK